VAHVPGVDVLFPSSAADAAGLLNAAFDSGRPTVFFYPKSGLADAARATSADVQRHYVPIGTARRSRQGTDITLVGWGNTVSLCERVADAIADVGFSADVLDLRSISPWDEQAVCASARATRRLVVVHEDNLTAGFGAEVVATVAERAGTAVRCQRVTRPDTYVPFHFGNQIEVLPSFERLLEVVARTLGLDLRWDRPSPPDAHTLVIQAVGSSPTDEAVTVVDVQVTEGNACREGEVLACLECNKALLDLEAPAAGIVRRIYVRPGEQVLIGAPLFELAVTSAARVRQPVREEHGLPVLTRTAGRQVSAGAHAQSSLVAGIRAIAVVRGELETTNEQLAARFGDVSPQDIYTRTGMRRRPIASSRQTPLSMAAQAAHRVLAAEGLQVSDLGLIVCSTSTPEINTPSLACLVLHELCRDGTAVEIPAFDVVAACTGYLYALASAWDHLQRFPHSHVLVVTSEVMTRIVDPQDFATAILFGDAATATLISGAENAGRIRGQLNRPKLAARGEGGSALRVPHEGTGEYVHMDGRKVFAEAVRGMTAVLEAACRAEGYTVDDLDLIVPHQANGRILEAVAARIGGRPDRVRNDIERNGNTSSSSIPLVLSEILAGPTDQRVGLCAFGAGFTYGAAIVEPPWGRNTTTVAGDPR
jgi:2-oxoisovalerate dehydrogenase E1 component